MIRQEIQWVVDDSHDSHNFKTYSSCGGSFQHRESGLVIASDWLAVPGWGAIKDKIDLSVEEAAAVTEAFQRVKETYDVAHRAKTWDNVKRRFKNRADEVYRLIMEKVGPL
jgi:hypothetical protein